MYTKIIVLIIQSYLIYRACIPPDNRGPSVKKVMATEGLSGVILLFLFVKGYILLSIIQSLFYIFIMYQQEIGSIPILSNKFSEWSSLEVLCFLSTSGGCLLRLWCYKSLKEFFTFDVNVKKDHKLITTGPYSLLVHPSYTGALMSFANTTLLWYQLHPYIPVYSSGFGEILLNLAYCYIIFQTVLFPMTIFRRILHEEGLLKKSFGKEWDIYFSQRKRIIPYII